MGKHEEKGKGKKMDQAADNQVGLEQAAESLPRDQRRRTIPQTETADNTSPRNRTRELEVGVVGRGRVLQTKAGRGIRSERPSSTGTDRGPWARVGAVRGWRRPSHPFVFRVKPGFVGSTRFEF